MKETFLPPQHNLSSTIRKNRLITIGVLFLIALSLIICIDAFSGRWQIIYVQKMLAEKNRKVNIACLTMPIPRKGQKILFIAPHEDDEIIACAGYFTKAIAAGATVHVVFVTNGDYRGKPMNVLTSLRKPRDYIALGYRRQQESLNALAQYGIHANNVTFLGYPNGPLYRMWLGEFWYPTHCAESDKTQCRQSPYSNSLTLQAKYCGESVTDDLAKVIQQQMPDIIFLPHPNDINSDHWAVSGFTRLALAELRARNFAGSNTCQLYTYLVHKHQWPAPMNYLPHTLLMPPASLIATKQTVWFSFPLTRQQTLKKHATLNLYKSQGGVLSPVLRTMGRPNELFGIVAPHIWTVNNQYSVQPVIVDATADTDNTYLIPSADILRITFGHVDELFKITFVLRGPIARDIQYHICLHAGGKLPEQRTIVEYCYSNGRVTATDAEKKTTPNNISAKAQGNRLQLTSGWFFSSMKAKQQNFIIICAWTTRNGHIINRTMNSVVYLNK